MAILSSTTTVGLRPIRAVDPAFTDLRAVCTELPLREEVGRYADNLLMNPDGRICQVECKLSTNAQADRDVLAQLLDYAAALSRLDYSSLRDRSREAWTRRRSSRRSPPMANGRCSMHGAPSPGASNCNRYDASTVTTALRHSRSESGLPT